MNRVRQKTPVLIFLMLFTSYVYAQNVSPPVVMIQTDPQQPVTGSSWTLTLIINHPYPNEVTVFPPAFAESLVLEQTQIVARIVESGGQMNRWTAAEYRFKLASQDGKQTIGTILFEPFTIVTPGGSVQTETISLTVLRTNTPIALPKPRLAWDGQAAGIQTGQAAAVNLVVSGWDSRFLLPPPQFFMPDLIDGAIIEVQELSNAEEGALVALHMQIIPLVPGTIVFPARTVSDQNISFAIPQLRITVSAPPVSLSASVEEQSEAGTQKAVLVPSPVTTHFREFQIPLALKGFSLWRYRMASTLFRSSYEDTCRNLEELWDNGHYVETLALLRRREKSAIAGLLYVHLRRQAEQSLGVNLSGKEPPRNFFPYPWRAYRYGVLKETPFRRIPDLSGESSGQFREGQPARISMMRKNQTDSGAQSWVWAETASQSGWIPEEMVIYF